MFHVEHSLPAELPQAPLMAVAGLVGVVLSPEQLQLTLGYLRLLNQWNATTSLLQARSWGEVAQRHVGEGWAASRLLPAAGPSSLRILDIGSGGGIPAVPMAIVRPDVEMTLLEPRNRKAAFLQAVARTLPAPPTRVIVRAQRLEELHLSERWDAICFRGIRLEPSQVLRHLHPEGLVLRFPSAPDESRSAWLSAGFMPVAEHPLPTQPLVVACWQRAPR